MSKIPGIEPHLTLPTASPIDASFANGEIEGDLKQLFADLFDQQLTKCLFDANVLGAPHLGTFDLVRRSVNADGLVLLPGSTEEDATRYLYRAWRSRDNDGRGLHFLKTYLQMLFPNLCSVEQMMQAKNRVYPLDLYPASKHGGDDDKYLTSRIEIIVDWASEMTNFTKLMSVFRAVIPARLTPLFRVRLTILLLIEALFDSDLLLQKSVEMNANACGLRVTHIKEHKWQLGADIGYTRLASEPVSTQLLIGQSVIKLPNYASDFDLRVDASWKIGGLIGGALAPLPARIDGTWQLGKKSGAECLVQLGNCKIKTDVTLVKDIDERAYRSRYLAEPDLKLNGQWQVGDRIVSFADLVASSDIIIQHDVISTFVDHTRLDYPFTPQKLGGVPKIGTWRSLNGQWQLGKVSRPSPFGFQLRTPSIYIEHDQALNKNIIAYVNQGKFTLPKTVTLSAKNKLAGGRKIGGAYAGSLELNGQWKVGSSKWTTESTSTLSSAATALTSQSVELSESAHLELQYPFRIKLAREPKLNAQHKLDGSWSFNKPETHTPFGFQLRTPSIYIEHDQALNKNIIAYVNQGKFTLPKTVTLSAKNKLAGGRKIGGAYAGSLELNGQWKVGSSKWTTESTSTLSSAATALTSQSVELSESAHLELQYPFRIKLAREPKLNAQHKLDGSWSFNKPETHTPFGFQLRTCAIPVESSCAVTIDKIADVFDDYTKLNSSPEYWGETGWETGGWLGKSIALDGSWFLGQRSQIVCSNADLKIETEIDVSSAADATIIISKSDSFVFNNALGDFSSYQLYLTQPITIIDNRIKLAVAPMGDVFLSVGSVFREMLGDYQFIEDHDAVTIVTENGDYYAQFDPATAGINGFKGQVSYLSAV